MPVTFRDRQLGLVNLQLPEVIADPWHYYALLRTTAPVNFDPFISSWLISRHCDVRYLLTHPATSVRMDHADSLATFSHAGLAEAFAALDLHVSFLDAPDHGRLRRVLADPLQMRRVRTDLADPIDQAITATLADIDDQQPVDVVSAISSQVPIRVSQHLLDLHDVDLATVQRWSHAWGDIISAPGHVPTSHRKELLPVVSDLVAHLEDLVARYERTTPNTIVGGLVAVMRRGGMTRDELIANLMMLVTAGTETTANLLANSIMALADDPILWAFVKARPDLIPDVAEELARIHAPTQYTARKTLAPIELSTGDIIPAGVSVVLMLAAANRDPDAFPDPDQVRHDRATARSVTYGHGPHLCLGAPLARQEVQRTLELLVDRYDRLTPLPGRRWRQNGNLRGLDALPLRLHATATVGAR